MRGLCPRALTRREVREPLESGDRAFFHGRAVFLLVRHILIAGGAFFLIKCRFLFYRVGRQSRKSFVFKEIGRVKFFQKT